MRNIIKIRAYQHLNSLFVFDMVEKGVFIRAPIWLTNKSVFDFIAGISSKKNSSPLNTIIYFLSTIFFIFFTLYTVICLHWAGTNYLKKKLRDLFFGSGVNAISRFISHFNNFSVYVMMTFTIRSQYESLLINSTCKHNKKKIAA